MRRSLGLFDVICIGLNAIVGSGIFLLPDDLYREMGGLSPLAFLLCAVGLLPIALCYAEAASRVDRTGGPYVYTSEAFGPFAGFAVGWMCFANAVFSFAAVALGAADYLSAMLPGASTPWTIKATALTLIAVFAALNYLGAKPGALAIDLFTVAKFAALILLVLALLPKFDAARLHEAAPANNGLSGIASATFLALFAAQGFEVVPVPAGETRAPQRHLPLAIVGSLLAASVLYVAVQTVLVGSFPGLGNAEKPVVEAARSASPLLGAIVAGGAVVSMIGFVSGSAFGTPRYLYAAAVDRHLPRALAEIHPRFESPHVAVVATGLLAAVLVIPFDYRSLIGMSNVAVAVQYLGTCLAVLRLPKVASSRIRGPWIPLLGALVSVSIFAPASKEELGWAGVSLAVGLVVVALTRRAARAAA